MSSGHFEFSSIRIMSTNLSIYVMTDDDEQGVVLFVL